MLTPDDIQTIEADLKERGISVAELCRRAEIAGTTWGRWKRGEYHPSYKAATSVRDALNSLIGNEKGAA